MIRLTREQFETLKRRENPEVFTSEQISNWIIDYSEMLQKAELSELDEVEKAAVDKFNDEFKSFTKVTVIDLPAEDSLQKGLIYTDFYIREQQIKWDDDVIIKSEDGKDIIEKAKSGVYTDTEFNRKMGRVGQRYGDKIEDKE